MGASPSSPSLGERGCVEARRGDIALRVVPFTQLLMLPPVAALLGLDDVFDRFYFLASFVLMARARLDCSTEYTLKNLAHCLHIVNSVDEGDLASALLARWARKHLGWSFKRFMRGRDRFLRDRLQWRGRVDREDCSRALEYMPRIPLQWHRGVLYVLQQHHALLAPRRAILQGPRKEQPRSGGLNEPVPGVIVDGGFQTPPRRPRRVKKRKRRNAVDVEDMKLLGVRDNAGAAQATAAVAPTVSPTHRLQSRRTPPMKGSRPGAQSSGTEEHTPRKDKVPDERPQPRGGDGDTTGKGHAGQRRVRDCWLLSIDEDAMHTK